MFSEKYSSDLLYETGKTANLSSEDNGGLQEIILENLSLQWKQSTEQGVIRKGLDC